MILAYKIILLQNLTTYTLNYFNVFRVPASDAFFCVDNYNRVACCVDFVCQDCSIVTDIPQVEPILTRTFYFFYQLTLLELIHIA